MDRTFILNSHHDRLACFYDKQKKKTKHSIWFSRIYKILYFIQFYPPQTTIPHDPSSKFYFSFNFTPLRLLSPMTLLLNYILGCEITIVANCNYAGNYIVSQ